MEKRSRNTLIIIIIIIIIIMLKPLKPNKSYIKTSKQFTSNSCYPARYSLGDLSLP